MPGERRRGVTTNGASDIIPDVVFLELEEIAKARKMDLYNTASSIKAEWKSVG